MKDIPAFPHSFVRHPTEETYITKGMTLRDYFAAKAMQGFMGSSWNVKSFEDMASKAYQLADAMMKARTDGL
jgi:hypothetical protein